MPVISQDFSAVSSITTLFREANNADSNSNEQTLGSGVFITPSSDVPTRPSDVTGYFLVAATEEGKLEFNSGDGLLSLEELSDVTITNLVAGDFLSYNGTSWVNTTIPGGSAAPPVNSVQFNNAGATGGSADFTWDGTLLNVVGNISAGNELTIGSSTNPTTLKTGASAAQSITLPDNAGNSNNWVLAVSTSGTDTLTEWKDASTLVTASPGGPFNSVQFNNAGSIGGDANFTWDGTLLNVVGNMESSVNVKGESLTATTGNLQLTSGYITFGDPSGSHLNLKSGSGGAEQNITFPNMMGQPPGAFLMLSTPGFDMTGGAVPYEGETTWINAPIYDGGAVTPSITRTVPYFDVIDWPDPTGADPTATTPLATVKDGSGVSIPATGEIVADTSVTSNSLVITGTSPNIKLGGATSGNTEIKAAAVDTTTAPLTLPDADGAAGSVLKNDGSGVLSWATDSATAAGPANAVQLNNGGVLGGSAALTFDTSELLVDASVHLTNTGVVYIESGEIILGDGSGNPANRVYIETSLTGSNYFRFPASIGAVSGQHLRITNVANGTTQWSSILEASDINATGDVALGAASQIGFFGTAPVVQGAAVTPGTDIASTQAAVNALIARLQAYGLLA